VTVSRPRVAAWSGWPTGTTAEDNAVQHDGQRRRRTRRPESAAATLGAGETLLWHATDEPGDWHIEPTAAPMAGSTAGEFDFGT